MAAQEQTPLSPIALTIGDLTPGKKIVRFNIHIGERGVFIIMGHPTVEKTHTGDCPMIELMDVDSSKRGLHSLRDLGVVPHPTIGFNKANFVVDYQVRRLLPTELVPERRRPGFRTRRRRGY